MRHLEIRDLWLQKEIREGRVEVHKVLGTENPADLMTKILTVKEIEERLRGMSIQMKLTNVQQMVLVEKSEMRKVGPTPISPFGVGQGEHISVCELKRDSRQSAYFLSRNEKSRPNSNFSIWSRAK